ncbi:MAG: 50S ribosomal protein L3 [Candidatus Pacebacteria bacterium]|nr:50S ribosomal protein L3 [Candidatus Paceibacterota bacterium]
MLGTIFATKTGMSQVWTKAGKRMPVTKFKVDQNIVLGQQQALCVDGRQAKNDPQPCLIFEIGYGRKKLKNMSKPLRQIIKKSGFSFGVKQIRGIQVEESKLNDQVKEQIKPGAVLSLADSLEVGDVVKVSGISKGRGFAGVMKRHGFKGGPRTHGQSDRERAPGSIGAGTDPGRVVKGKKMPGHMGAEKKTIENLVVLYIDPDSSEIWLSGPVPGSKGGINRITKVGATKEIELNFEASGIKLAQSKDEEVEKEADSQQEASPTPESNKEEDK